MIPESTTTHPPTETPVEQWENTPWKLRFFTIWTGQSLSLIGSALTQFVLVWWITENTGSAGALATAGIMALLPQALFGPLGGTLADRWNRRLIMIVADAITALCMVILIILFSTNTVQLWHIYALMFTRSAMQAFQSPAAVASTSMLVPPSWFSRVSGMNQTVQGLMSVAAAPLGAVALGFLPLQGALMIDVVTAVLGIVPLFFFRIPQPTRANIQQSSVWQDFRSALHLIGQNRGLLWLYSLTVLMIGLLMPSFILVPLLITDFFGGGVNEVALMEGISGVGMILGGIALSIIAIPRRQILVVLGAFTIACLTIALAGITPNNMFWLATLWWFLCGLAFSIGNAPIIAILQTIVPNEMQGRAISLFSTLVGIAGPAGLVIAAPLGEIIGVRGVLIGGGLLATLVCIAGFFSPSLMRIDKQKIAETPL